MLLISSPTSPAAPIEPCPIVSYFLFTQDWEESKVTRQSDHGNQQPQTDADRKKDQTSFDRDAIPLRQVGVYRILMDVQWSYDVLESVGLP